MAGAGFVLSPLLLSARSHQPKNNNNQGNRMRNKKDNKMKNTPTSLKFTVQKSELEEFKKEKEKKKLRVLSSPFHIS